MTDALPSSYPVDGDQILAVRRFNRFHTHLVGALGEHLLASDLSLPQCRVLYEIAQAPKDDPPSATELGRALRMDAGYLSRLLSGLETLGLIRRESVPENAKRLILSLTDQGKAQFDVLNAASSQEVAALLAPLAVEDRRRLVGAMGCIRQLLGDNPGDLTFVLRAPEPGDLGLIIHGQARLYHREYGWDWTFEALISQIIAQFVQDFVPEKERCWVAERDGGIVGSVFVVRQDDTTAKLRMLYVDETARGLGLGRRLVDEAIRFARARGYQRMELWTNDILVAARRIYETSGFELLEEEPHHSFGKDLVGQVWARDL